MLHAFGVKNYYNLNMETPVVLHNNVSFVYGICGSGKTNLCRALGDIIEVSSDIGVEKRPLFYYHFSYYGFDLIYEYVRDCVGQVGHASLLIPQFEFLFEYTETLCKPMDIFQVCRTFERREVDSIIDMFEEHLLCEFKVIIPECKAKLRENLHKCDLEKKEIDLENKVMEASKGMTLIIDDFEYNGMLSPALLMNDILSRRHQAIVTVRRSEWIDNVYGDLGQFYFIKNGSLISAVNCLQKEIRSVNQLKNLFIKGSFDMEQSL